MILALGLNHKTAPLAIREQLAFDAAQTPSMLSVLKRRFPQAEFVLLSTCNRVELYCAGTREAAPSGEVLTKLLAKARGAAHGSFQPHLYIHRNEEAVRHLMTVTASLDSMVVGETEILGQVKESYRIALEAGATGQILNRLFNLAVATGKKVHSQTSLSNSRASVPGLAVQLVGRTAPGRDTKVMVIGAGEMGELLVRLLLEEGYEDITVVNRSGQRGMDVASRHGVKAVRWESLGEQLHLCDVAISSAAATEYIVGKCDMAVHVSERIDDLLVVDIGVPRNFDPAIAELPGVRLYSIDDLSPLLCEQPGIGSDEIARSFDLIYRSASDFMHWFASRELGPLIGRMRQRFNEIAAEELNGFLSVPRTDVPSREDIGLMLSRIVGKLSHCVIEQVDSINRRHGTADAARFLESVLEHAEEVYADPARMEEFVK
jgi:glutamyl-tRNA reductase